MAFNAKILVSNQNYIHISAFLQFFIVCVLLENFEQRMAEQKLGKPAGNKNRLSVLLQNTSLVDAATQLGWLYFLILSIQTHKKNQKKNNNEHFIDAAIDNENEDEVKRILDKGEIKKPILAKMIDQVIQQGSYFVNYHCFFLFVCLFCFFK